MQLIFGSQNKDLETKFSMVSKVQESVLYVFLEAYAFKNGDIQSKQLCILRDLTRSILSFSLSLYLYTGNSATT